MLKYALIALLISNTLLACSPQESQEKIDHTENTAQSQSFEVKNVVSHSHDHPLKSGVWQLNAKATQLHFEILKKPKTMIKGQLTASGGHLTVKNNAIDSGIFTVDLTQINTKSKSRDRNILTSFFGLGKMPDAVAKIWKQIGSQLKTNQSQARFKLKKVTIKGHNAQITGHLKLWGTQSIPLSFAASVNQSEGQVVIQSKKAAIFDLGKAMPKVQPLLYDAMTAIGCPHPNGVGTQVHLYFDKIVLNKATKS